MNNREMGKKIRQALEHAAPAGPEKLSEILSRCDHQEGEPIMPQLPQPYWLSEAAAWEELYIISGIWRWIPKSYWMSTPALKFG